MLKFYQRRILGFEVFANLGTHPNGFSITAGVGSLELDINVFPARVVVQAGDLTKDAPYVCVQLNRAV